MYHPKGIQLITTPKTHLCTTYSLSNVVNLVCHPVRVSLQGVCLLHVALRLLQRALDTLHRVEGALGHITATGNTCVWFGQISQYTKQIISRAVTKLKKIWFFKENRGFSPEQSTYTEQSVKKHLIITKNKFNVLITCARLFEGKLALTQSYNL